MQQVLAHQLAKWLKDAERPQPLLLDVREAWEVEIAPFPSARHIPMHLIPLQIQDLGDPDQPVVAICHHGGRSMQVALFLERQGFSNVFNLAGGINAWSRDVDPSVACY